MGHSLSKQDALLLALYWRFRRYQARVKFEAILASRAVVEVKSELRPGMLGDICLMQQFQGKNLVSADEMRIWVTCRRLVRGCDRG